MRTIRQILKEKGSDLWCISPEATVYEAMQLLADKDIGALPVMENDKLVGIFSERDYARKLTLEGRDTRTTRVRDLMSTRVFSIAPEKTNEQGLALMTERHVRHLPVISGRKMVGFISIGDLVKSIIDEQKTVIEKLEKYASQS